METAELTRSRYRLVRETICVGMSHLGDDSLSAIKIENEKVDAADVTFKQPLLPSKMHESLHIQNSNVPTQLKKDKMDINI